MYDDFVEVRPGALSELDNLLQIYGKEVTANDTIEALDVETVPDQSRGWKPISSIINAWTRFLTVTKTSATLPRYHQDKDEDFVTIGACTRVGSEGAGAHDFVLLCIPFMRVAKLYQPEICRINSDQEFFKLLRHCYETKRGQRPWKLLRKVKSINFVKVILQAPPSVVEGIANQWNCSLRCIATT